MATNQPAVALNPHFSSENATPTPWPEAVALIEQAEVFWLATVRPDGRPHVTPLIAVWIDGALYITTGPNERKAKNLTANSHCVITTGCNTLGNGLDLVIEGAALEVSDEAMLQRIADGYAAKYGTSTWDFTVRDGALRHAGGGDRVLVYEVTPTTAFGFGKGETFSQTAWRFSRAD